VLTAQNAVQRTTIQYYHPSASTSYSGCSANNSLPRKNNSAYDCSHTGSGYLHLITYYSPTIQVTSRSTHIHSSYTTWFCGLWGGYATLGTDDIRDNGHASLFDPEQKARIWECYFGYAGGEQRSFEFMRPPSLAGDSKPACTSGCVLVLVFRYH